MPEPVTVFETLDLLRANFAASILEKEGIHCIVLNPQTQHLAGIGVTGQYNPLFGPIRVQVNEEDLNKARDLLEAAQPGNDLQQKNEEEEQDKEYSPESVKQIRKAYALYYLIAIAAAMIAAAMAIK